MQPNSFEGPGVLEGYTKLFYSALRIRLLEEKIAEIYPTDKIQSPVHLSIGQEHVSVGVCEALKPDDMVFGTYRGHALYLAKGGDLKAMVAELFGKITGCGKGKAGSMHLSDKSAGVMGCSAIVASTIPHAVGAALASKVQKKKQLVVCFFGEGSTGEGVYHESLNLAARFRLPVLFVCENNDLAIFSKVSSTHSFNVSEHAKTYGLRTQYVEEGYDLEKIFEVAKNARTRIVDQELGPELLEFRTYRTFQHVGPGLDDHLKYRDPKEGALWKSLDPLDQRKDLVEKFKPRIMAEIQSAVDFAESSPFPDGSNLLEDVL